MRLSLFIPGVFAAIVCIAFPALAQYASQSNSAHHGRHLRVSSPPSDSLAFTSPLETPGFGLAIQRDDRMFMFQERHRIAAVFSKVHCYASEHEAGVEFFDRPRRRETAGAQENSTARLYLRTFKVITAAKSASTPAQTLEAFSA